MALATVKEEIIDARYSRTLEAWNYKKQDPGNNSDNSFAVRL